VVALALFGYIKGRFTGVTPLNSTLHTLAIGSAAAAAAFILARIFA
jgi:VIT1/CCC1 family predicted Fe2+/Mn2+ transporter